MLQYLFVFNNRSKRRYLITHVSTALPVTYYCYSSRLCSPYSLLRQWYRCLSFECAREICNVSSVLYTYLLIFLICACIHIYVCITHISVCLCYECVCVFVFAVSVSGLWSDPVSSCTRLWLRRCYLLARNNTLFYWLLGYNVYVALGISCRMKYKTCLK
jgi:hypothetical protein